MMSTNKTGYEIRADTLHLAQSIPSDRMHNSSELVDGARVKRLYTTDEVIDEATKLAKFVDTKCKF
jgi:hypothetical protein